MVDCRIVDDATHEPNHLGRVLDVDNVDVEQVNEHPQDDSRLPEGVARYLPGSPPRVSLEQSFRRPSEVLWCRRRLENFRLPSGVMWRRLRRNQQFNGPAYLQG